MPWQRHLHLIFYGFGLPNLIDVNKTPKVKKYF